jgi:hypothetical protein
MSWGPKTMGLYIVCIRAKVTGVRSMRTTTIGS